MTAVSSCFHGCPAFLHRHFPPQSPPSHLIDPSLRSQQQPLPRDCSTVGKLQLPATVPSISVCDMYGCTKDSLILIPFRLPQISYFTLRLKCFSSYLDSCPDVGIRPLLQFPHLPRADPVLLTLLFFPIVPSSYQVLCGSVYSFSTGQGFLSTPCWCSACTSVPGGVFLIYLWREMYSTSTYFSAILMSFLVWFRY